MKEYVALPEGFLHDRGRLSSWVGKALAYGESLAPKKTKTKSKAAGREPKTAKRNSRKGKTKKKS